MLAEHVALLVQRRGWRGRLATQKRERLGEDPRVADRAAGHAHAVDARLAEHRHAGLGRKQVARAEHDAVSRVPFHRREKLPVARADVLLLHGAAVHRDRRHAAGEGAVEDGPEVVGALGRVVEAAPHLERDGHVRRHGVAHAAHDVERRLGLAEQIAAAAPAEHFLDGAAKIDVDHVEPRLNEPPRRGRKIIRVRPHELAADGVLLVSDGHTGEVALVPPDHGHERVEQHLAERVGRTEPPGEHPHRQVAVAGERRLHHGGSEGDAADRQAGHVSTGHRSNHVRPCAAIHSTLAIGPQSPGS